MPTVRRGTSHYVSDAAMVSHDVPIPVGAQADDWAIIGVCNQAWGAAFTLPGTVLLEAGNNTMRYGLCVKQLNVSDVAAGFLSVESSSAQQVAAVCVAYSEAIGVESVGDVWNKGAVSLPYTMAPAVVSDGSQDILVFSLIKHSSGSQAYSSSAPATTPLASAIKNGSGIPSAFVGVYSGIAQDRTNTWAAASTNGVGFQVAVAPSSTTPGTGVEVVGVWSGSAVQPVELLGSWNGTSVDGVESIDLT